jgi:carboxymethylenebutenolidase
MVPALLLVLTGCAAKVEVNKPAHVVATPLRLRLGDKVVRGILYDKPPDRKPRPALVLIHADRGLTDWEKEQARRLAGKGYVVLAVDLYRGATTPDVMDAHIMGRALPDDRVMADLKSAVDLLAGLRWVRHAAIGVIGWDIGGGYALDAALRDRRLRAVVVCYGRLTTDPALLAPLQAPVLGIFAGKDEGISAKTIDQFRAAMRKAGKRVAGTDVYPTCGHGFMDPASPENSAPPDTAAVADAWDKIDTFLAAELKP